MRAKPEEIVSVLREEIQNYDTRVRRDETGTVLEVGDGIATVYGLDQAVYGELVELDTGVKGMVMNLARDSVGVVLLGSEAGVREGTVVRRTGRAADVPVGDGLIGRVVDVLGQPIDGLGPIETTETRPIEDYSIIVSSTASESAPLQYIAPYSGAAMGEYFMGKGKDVLIVYDDLSKHAVAYRTLSLLLKRSPGREAYPGDVFYLHSRLLERACRLTKEYGGGSMTALPIIETQAGDVSAYIPTNVISITDGQIYLETDLFFAGQRPAVNVGLSVSRVGGAAQTRAIKKTAGTLRIDLARFRELEVFTQFASDLDPATQQALDHGRRLLELLKQPLYHPMPVSRQAILLYVATSGLVDDVPLEHVRPFVLGFAGEIEAEHPDVVAEIESTGTLSGPAVECIRAALADAKKRGSATWQA